MGHGRSYRLCKTCGQPVKYMGPGRNAFWMHDLNFDTSPAKHKAIPGSEVIGCIIKGKFVPCKPVDAVKAVKKIFEQLDKKELHDQNETDTDPATHHGHD